MLSKQDLDDCWVGTITVGERGQIVIPAEARKKLLINPGEPEVKQLSTPGMVLGGMTGTKYVTKVQKMEMPCTLYVVSDGTFEISLPDGAIWPFEDYVKFLADATASGKPALGELENKVRELHGPGALDDDFSILKVDFSRQ